MIMASKNNSRKVHSLITEQIKDVQGCLISFENFLRAATTAGTVHDTLSALAESVHQMENAADRSLRTMIDSLGGAFLPSTRQDLIEIATKCDRIANKCEHTAMTVVLQRFLFPEEFASDLLQIQQYTHKQFDVLAESISLLFSKFGELLNDHSILDKIREYESKVDEIEKGLYERIFTMDVDLAHQMQISNFVELVCDVSDIIENIADHIQIMLITRKA